jgi:hypothetical protein
MFFFLSQDLPNQLTSNLVHTYSEYRFTYLSICFFPTSLMKMILSSLNLVRKIGVCITSEENGESKLTSEENLFNNLRTYYINNLLPTY